VSNSNPPVLSYSSQVLPPRWARLLMRPLGWPFFTLLTLAALYILWQFRVPFANRGPRTISFAIAALFGSLWLLRLILPFVLRRIYRVPQSEFRPRLWRYAIPLITALTLILLIQYDVPATLAWRLSEPALRRHAQAIFAAEAAKHPPALGVVYYPDQWVGLYRLERVTYYSSPNTLIFDIPAADEGFAYSPAGPPPDDHFLRGFARPRYTPWKDDWYRVDHKVYVITWHAYLLSPEAPS
jgi:hypothetical protein